uniref:Uncharacterized protein n=1 Tax=Solanum lycopersicum TaxID=4081 RepID=K4D013_SOLLC
MKEHVLISIFATAGVGFGNGCAYAISIKVLYHRKISFLVMGYGWAGIMNKYVVEPAEMWWPSTLAQVSIFRALHEKENAFSVLCLAFPKSVLAHQLGSGQHGLGILSFTFDWSVFAFYTTPLKYNVSAIVMNTANYEAQGRITLSIIFSIPCGLGFATIIGPSPSSSSMGSK